MRKKLLLLTAVVYIQGCATSPGQLNESNFNWNKQTVDIPINQVDINLLTGFRKCGSEFPNVIRQKDIFIYDIFLPGGIFGNSNYVLGKIELQSYEGKTKMKAGVLRKYDSPIIGSSGRLQALWEEWAKGNIHCR